MAKQEDRILSTVRCNCNGNMYLRKIPKESSTPMSLKYVIRCSSCYRWYETNNCEFDDSNI